jgi:hypothetical protein
MTGTPDESPRGRPQGLYSKKRTASSPRCFEGQDRSSTNPSTDRGNRFESLNDVAGRESRVYRKSPPAPRGRSSINASGPTVAAKAHTIASRLPRCFEEDERLSANPSIDRASGFELLNDMTGRKLRVYRKSPPPPTRRISSAVHESDSE